MAYEMGRHIIGYEVQKVLAAVDWFCREKTIPRSASMATAKGDVGLYAGAVDCGSGAGRHRLLRPARGLWQEPIYRNVWGCSASSATRKSPCCSCIGADSGKKSRSLLIGDGLALRWTDRRPSAPAVRRPRRSARAFRRGAVGTPSRLEQKLRFAVKPVQAIQGLISAVMYGDEPVCPALSWSDCPRRRRAAERPSRSARPPADRRKDFDPAVREHRQFDQLVAFTQKVMRDSERNRQQPSGPNWILLRWKSTRRPAKPFRKQLEEEVIGKLPDADGADEPAHAASLR